MKTEANLLHELGAMTKTKGSSQSKVAKTLGISSPFLSDVLKGRRDISSRLAEAMGYKKIVMFERLPKKVDDEA